MGTNANSNLSRRAVKLATGGFKNWADFIADHAPSKQEEPNEKLRAKKALNRAKGTLSLFRTYYGGEAGFNATANTVFFKPGKTTPDYVLAGIKAAKPRAAAKPAKAKPAAAPVAAA